MHSFINTLLSHCDQHNTVLKYNFDPYNEDVEDIASLVDCFCSLTFECQPYYTQKHELAGLIITHNGVQQHLCFLDGFVIEIPDTSSVEILAIAFCLSGVAEMMSPKLLSMDYAEGDDLFLTLMDFLTQNEGKKSLYHYVQLTNEFPTVERLQEWMNLNKTEIPEEAIMIS